MEERQKRSRAFTFIRSERQPGSRVVTVQEPPPSLELKRYFKDDSQIPSPGEVARLAEDVYLDGSEAGQELVSGWFAQRDQENS